MQLANNNNNNKIKKLLKFQQVIIKENQALTQQLHVCHSKIEELKIIKETNLNRICKEESLKDKIHSLQRVVDKHCDANHELKSQIACLKTHSVSMQQEMSMLKHNLIKSNEELAESIAVQNETHAKLEASNTAKEMLQARLVDVHNKGNDHTSTSEKKKIHEEELSIWMANAQDIQGKRNEMMTVYHESHACDQGNSQTSTSAVSNCTKEMNVPQKIEFYENGGALACQAAGNPPQSPLQVVIGDDDIDNDDDIDDQLTTISIHNNTQREPFNDSPDQMQRLLTTATTTTTPYSNKKNDDDECVLDLGVGNLDLSADVHYYSGFKPLVGIIRGSCLQQTPSVVNKSCLRLLGCTDNVMQIIHRKIGSQPVLRYMVVLYIVFLHIFALTFAVIRH